MIPLHKITVLVHLVPHPLHLPGQLGIVTLNNIHPITHSFDLVAKSDSMVEDE